MGRRGTTAKTLERLLYDEDCLLRFLAGGFSKADRHTFRHRFETGKLSSRRMAQILTACGYRVVQELLWE